MPARKPPIPCRFIHGPPPPQSAAWPCRNRADGRAPAHPRAGLGAQRASGRRTDRKRPSQKWPVQPSSRLARLARRARRSVMHFMNQESERRRVRAVAIHAGSAAFSAISASLHACALPSGPVRGCALAQRVATSAGVQETTRFGSVRTTMYRWFDITAYARTSTAKEPAAWRMRSRTQSRRC